MNKELLPTALQMGRSFQTLGDSVLSRDIAQTFGAVSSEQFSESTPEEQRHYLHLWRLWVESSLSLAQNAPTGDAAALYLHEARDVIDRFYASRREKIDPEIAAGVQRDRGRYLLHVAFLTGNVGFIQQAISEFGIGLDISSPQGEEYMRAGMERLYARSQLLSGLLPQEFKEMRSVYKQIIHNDAIDKVGKREASKMYMVSSMESGHILGTVHGALRTIQYAPRRIGKMTPTPSDAVNYIKSGLQERVIERRRRNSFTGDAMSLLPLH